MSLAVTNLGGFGGGSSATPVEISYTDWENKNAITTSYSFTGKSFGAADASRYIAVAAGNCKGDLNPVITGMTIGGVTATKAVQIDGTLQGTNRGSSAIYIAAVPTGTTGTVVVTSSGQARGCTIAVYRLVGISSITPTSTGTDRAANEATSLSCVVTTVGGGAVIGTADNRAANLNHSWTNLTEDVEYIQTAAQDHTFSAASASIISPSSLTVTMTDSGAGDDNPTLAVAHWSPA